MVKKKDRCGECCFRGFNMAVNRCDFATITGRTRRGQPPEKCTYFVKGERIKKVYGHEKTVESGLQKRKNVHYKWDWDAARKLYDQGMNDGEISRATGIRTQTIATWRRREKLPANTTAGGRFKKQTETNKEDKTP